MNLIFCIPSTTKNCEVNNEPELIQSLNIFTLCIFSNHPPAILWLRECMAFRKSSFSWWAVKEEKIKNEFKQNCFWIKQNFFGIFVWD